jgi:hypothetical protein
LADLHVDLFGFSFLGEIRQEQKLPCKPFFARIEKLID